MKMMKTPPITQLRMEAGPATDAAARAASSQPDPMMAPMDKNSSEVKPSDFRRWTSACSNEPSGSAVPAPGVPGDGTAAATSEAM
ncbi:hypothetical protein [Aciditerrimonas ferrireducens]|uniref:hypothetical protein n=1 Tax=Aciditerrimonas ferrireducens TaxID=667306 RepID=UPI002003DE2B|nr:hypothetical protein [Aciditerrimonas ferrireducens]MCK4177819.1 hypothetical protein [Aciditerrimonas ferrireducens]